MSDLSESFRAHIIASTAVGCGIHRFSMNHHMAAQNLMSCADQTWTALKRSSGHAHCLTPSQHTSMHGVLNPQPPLVTGDQVLPATLKLRGANMLVQLAALTSLQLLPYCSKILALTV